MKRRIIAIGILLLHPAFGHPTNHHHPRSLFTHVPHNGMVLLLQLLLLHPSRNAMPGMKRLSYRKHANLNPPLVCGSMVGDTQETSSSSTGITGILEWRHPMLGCDVTLVGVIHGSSSSAKDVQNAIEGKSKYPADVVVLELCSSRFADMKREMMVQKELPLGVESVKSHKTFWNTAKKFINLISITAKKKGMPSAIAAFLIGGVSLIQTALSGFTPGLEFITAINAVDSLPNECDIILADRDVSETLRRVGQIPSISLRYFQYIFSDRDINKVKNESKSLMRAIFGDTSIPHQISMGQALTKTEEMKNDLIKLTVPPAIGMGVAANFVSSFSSSPVQALVATQQSDDTILSQDIYSMYDFIMDFSISSAIILGFYFFLGLPSSQVIVSERDELLANGIEAACKEAVKKSRDNSNSPGRVVAVLGMLHMNGVAARLLAGGFEEKDR